ncbi:unnamed protein product [Rotaria socialis]|uniref:J domain-containing protein n=1 Tax=Rotaria socialis TaxID=392032 RepID=A0A820M2Z9_9BILA|nr:unnamed protein product [Rotaria socialis]CAF3314841.1 unnamed protein product [Rotaria socialis]CAF3332289.1 unnamed protein product [Rotaria socialis]CAF3336336.1 unnamed protein product [Rotaria socialis]CAF3457212.1 unnamed protein product [Rotaria socialis]
MKFDYDEGGEKLYYFILPRFAFILLSLPCYLRPRREEIKFVSLAYHAPLITTENEDYDPFAILAVDKEAPISEIKRVCHELSKINHPDRGGDPEEFLKK